MGLLQDMKSSEPLDHPYLRSQLIAYIGNKRRLLPFLHALFGRLHNEKPVASAIDPFAGSGAVARLLRWMGCAVYANDWEHYAFVLNRAFVTIGAERASQLFSADGGLAAVIESLNRLGGEPVQPYISRWYAPRQTDTADYRTERLFYTRENALFIDSVRFEIDRRYPPLPGDRDRDDQRKLLIALLLYEAATHANTSGVFKAYHKGFGGHSGDALKRIMTPMQLEIPCLIDADQPAEAGEEDAASYCAGRPADLVYLDPPYNQHQYGSNYFMLNTIARWDRPPVEDGRESDGTLRAKAGIRPDWTVTRSDFCSHARAPAAFRRLLDSIDAERIVVSYNDRGALAIEALLDLGSERGSVSIESTDYASYRGGRQSLHRRAQSHEFALLIRSRRTRSARSVEREEPIASRESRETLRRSLRVRELASLRSRRVHPARARQLPPCVHLDALLRIEAVDAETMTARTEAELQQVCDAITEALCRDHAEEALVLIELIEGQELAAADRSLAWRELFRSLRKLAHRKYRVRFDSLCSRVEEIAGRYPGGARQSEASPALALLEELRTLAARRAAG